MIKPIRTILVALSLLFAAPAALAQEAEALTTLLAEHAETIQKGSRKTIQPAIDALAGSGLASAEKVLGLWREKALWARKADGAFFTAEATDDRKVMALFDLLTGEPAGTAEKKALKQIKPNSGVRALIGAALVRFQLTAADPAKRREALEAIQRDPAESQLAPLRAAIDGEADPELQELKARLERLLTIRFDKDEAARIEAIRGFAGDLGVDVRAALNPILASKIVATDGAAPAANIAARLTPGDDIDAGEAYALLASAGLAPADIPVEAQKTALTENIVDGRVGGLPLASLSDPEARAAAYAALAAEGSVPPAPTAAEKDAALAAAGFFAVYDEPSAAVTTAAKQTVDAIDASVATWGVFDLGLDALSLASIYFLAAIGLAITFGVMGVINMAHGEFIMMGAYTGYVVQLFIPDYTLSIIVAIPLAFAITFGAGVAMERLVIRWLYNRPLETLLATFGVSIALQQIAKNVFGTQARPLTAPDWLSGSLVINEVVSISWIRVAIFVLSALFLIFLILVMNRTRLGLEVRAVMQNPRMAASMGIDPDRIRMMTFGLGSGIAGIAGVAIGLFAKVTSGLGQDYIVQSFMTVVTGGVGNLLGVLAGAGIVGALQKVIEAFNPSNTLAAQTYMIIFVIIFIQFRPKGVFALKGRAAEA